jgi:hypothetical protein
MTGTTDTRSPFKSPWERAVRVTNRLEESNSQPDPASSKQSTTIFLVARRVAQEADLLIVADGLEMTACEVSQLCALQSFPGKLISHDENTS